MHRNQFYRHNIALCVPSGSKAPRPHRDSAHGPRWGTSVPQTPCSPVTPPWQYILDKSLLSDVEDIYTMFVSGSLASSLPASVLTLLMWSFQCVDCFQRRPICVEWYVTAWLSWVNIYWHVSVCVCVCVTETEESVDCSVRNGGCEYTCVRGTPDRCTCPGGLTLSPSNRTCVGRY